jgi:hypothetical protein
MPFPQTFIKVSRDAYSNKIMAVVSVVHVGICSSLIEGYVGLC